MRQLLVSPTGLHDGFGAYSVALDGDTLVAGAPTEDSCGTSAVPAAGGASPGKRL